MCWTNVVDFFKTTPPPIPTPPYVLVNIRNRPGQFDYQTVLQSGLLMGSGDVESAHRYLIQARLKLSGAWWKIDNAAKMLALRVARTNDNWNANWSGPHWRAA